MNIKQLRTTFTIVCFTQFAKILNSKIHLTLGPHTFLHRITTSGVKIRFCLLKWWGQRGWGGGWVGGGMNPLKRIILKFLFRKC